MTGIDDDPTLPDGEHPLFDPALDDVPRLLGGRYTLEERVGVGGGAVVWRAFDEALSRTVAIKLLRPSVARPDEAATRLRREAATAGRAAHPGIVAVYDTGSEDGTAWLALEHVDGPTLLDVLRHHPQGLPPQVAAAVAEQTAVALGHAHRRGLVHRDVKPANLLVTAEGVVKLADFGVAVAADDEQDPELAGSRGYAAPEQLLGRDGADAPPVDVFALGVVLHECLTGRPAFLAPTRRAQAELLSPRQVRPDVPRDLDEVVRRATRPDAADRYADGAAMATALRPLVASDPFELAAGLVRVEPSGRVVPAAAPRSPEGAATSSDTAAAGDRRRMDWRWVLAALLVLALTAGLTALMMTATTDEPHGELVDADAGVPVSGVALFDPYGSVGTDDTMPAAAVDGDPTTVWRTPRYPVPLRSLGTPGLGFWIDLGTDRAIEALELDLRTGGITVELLAATTAPRPGTTEADWQSLDSAVRPGDTVRLTADGTSARYWLVWVTELEPVGETWQAAVTDVRFLPVTGTP